MEYYINYLKDLYDEIKDDSESDKKNSKKSEFEELNSTESYSDESDSVVKNIFNNKKQNNISINTNVEEGNSISLK